MKRLMIMLLVMSGVCFAKEFHIPRRASLSVVETSNGAITVAASNASNAVKNSADYVCDGTADEVEIAAALNALPNTGYGIGRGGTVMLSAGLFSISTTLYAPAANFALIGSGSRYGTALKLASGANCTLFESTGSYHGKIQNIYFDGNGENQSAGVYVVRLSAGYYVVDDCYIMYGRNDGIRMSTQDTHVTNTFVEFCGGDGWVIESTQNVQLINCTAWGNKRDGMELSGYRGTLINPRVCWNNNAQESAAYRAGIEFLDGAADWQIIGGYFQGNAGHGIRFSTGTISDISIIGCDIHDNGQYDGLTRYDGIRIGGAATINSIVISGNTIWSSGHDNDNYIVVAEDLSASSPITCTQAHTTVSGAGKFVNSKIKWELTHAQITEFDIDIVGVSCHGESITETVTEADGWSGVLPLTYKSITSVTFTRGAGTGVGDTLKIGTYQAKQKYGINEKTGTNYNAICGNVVHGNYSDQILETGAQTVVSGNVEF